MVSFIPRLDGLSNPPVGGEQLLAPLVGHDIEPALDRPQVVEDLANERTGHVVAHVLVRLGLEQTLRHLSRKPGRRGRPRKRRRADSNSRPAVFALKTRLF